MVEEACPLLSVDSLKAGYGKKQVVKGVTLSVACGEIVTLIGHNGAGKSTLLKAIFGMIPISEGHIIFDGNTVLNGTPRQALSMGIGYTPQGNRVFPEMTVLENLEMGGVTLKDKSELSHGIERVFSFFPMLKERLKQRAGTLSGGEKQILSLANTLILSPRLLLLDEPSLGLAPALVSGALERIQQISDEFNVAVLIVEQKVREALSIAERVYVIRNGVISFEGPTESLDDSKIREVFL